MNKSLQIGENLTLSTFKGTVIVTHDISYSIDISLIAFLVTDMDKVQGNNGIVFYNQPEGPSGVATLISPYDMGNTKNHKIDFDMSKAPAGITKIAVTLSEDNATGFSNVKNLRAEIHAGDDVIQLADSNFTNENGVVVLELYLKNGQAKARAVLRGFNCGLDGLCKIYGIEIANSVEQSQSAASQTTQKQIPQIQAIKPSIVEPVAVKSNIGEETAGVVFSNVSNASTIYGMDKFNTPRGHGFAAERANHLYDKLTGKDAKIVGDDNVKFGADRVVDGVNLQSKYCNSGSKCIQECFQDGKFKYINPDGSPMKIEVPSDKYDAAVQAMENRIKNGEVRGVTDPSEAKNIVRKGNFTYEQARNIAKVGTVESITFDAVNGAIIATTAFGISTALTFATSIWNGDDFDVALKSATYSGLKVGGTTFVTAVLASQLSKAGLNSALVGSSEVIVSIMGPKASAMLVNAFRSGTNIYGAAAMKSAAKMLRGNAITGAVSVVVLSSVDVVNIFRGRISGAQLFKNVACTASTVAGGTAGWVGGAAAGAAVGSFVPIIGTAVGGIVGGLLGSFAAGSAASKVSNVVLCEFIEDDVDEMVRIIEKVFTQLAEDYLLSEKEAENIIENLKEDLTSSTLKDMFSSSNRQEFAQKLLINHFESEVKKRKKVSMPSQEEMQKGLRSVLEEMSDNIAIA